MLTLIWHLIDRQQDHDEVFEIHRESHELFNQNTLEVV